MHAGFVNAGGILLARFAPLFYNEQLLWLIVLIGGLGALLGKFWKFVHPNFKRKLGCSTVSQMGFMILQCGLGFFTAAITHLILHGFYKAYLFLSSGSRVEHTMPSDKDSGVAWLAQLPAILVSGLAGGYLFAMLTGKNGHLDSGLFLTFVVVLTIIHGTQSILKRSSIVGWIRVIALPLLILPALAIYALVFNGVSLLMADVPMAEVPMQLTWVHGLMMALYLFAFLAIEFEWYKMSRRLYVL
jgi:NAD(P)H-quinone oxidoreductase subunit 5